MKIFASLRLEIYMEAEGQFVGILRNVLRDALIQSIEERKLDKRRQEWFYTDKKSISLILLYSGIGIEELITDFDIPSIPNRVIDFCVGYDLVFILLLVLDIISFA